MELIWGHKVALFVRLIELVTRVPRLSRRSELDLEPVRPRSKSRYLILFGGISFMIMFLTMGQAPDPTFHLCVTRKCCTFSDPEAQFDSF